MQRPFPSGAPQVKWRKLWRSFGVLCCAALLAELASAPATVSAQSGALAVTAVTPTSGYNFQAATLDISGANFTATPTVRLGNVPLTGVTFTSSSRIRATIPRDLPAGTYGLTVINPDGQSASLANAFSALASGDGSFGFSHRAGLMLTPRYQFAAAYANGYLYALGG